MEVFVEEQKISREQILGILEKYPKERRYSLAVMQDMQRLFGYVPKEGLEKLSEHLGCPLMDLYSMATFYKALSLKPKGKHVIKVCDGTACHVRGSVNLIDAIQRTLGIGPDETTEDRVFSLELVNCVGACALAPVMVIDGKYYGKLAMEALPGVFQAVREGEAL